MRAILGSLLASLRLYISYWLLFRRARRSSTATLGLGGDSRKQRIHHPNASVLRPSPSARNGAAARPGCPFRLCPLERPKARPPSRSVEPKIGLVLSPQAAGLACPQLCRRWLTAATAGRGYAVDLFLEVIFLKYCP